MSAPLFAVNLTCEIEGRGRPAPVRTMLPVASLLPSGEKATDMIGGASPLRVMISLPAAASQSLTLRSQLPTGVSGAVEPPAGAYQHYLAARDAASQSKLFAVP